jgi:hypothetical protein
MKFGIQNRLNVARAGYSEFQISSSYFYLVKFFNFNINKFSEVRED